MIGEPIRFKLVPVFWLEIVGTENFVQGLVKLVKLESFRTDIRVVRGEIGKGTEIQR